MRARISTLNIPVTASLTQAPSAAFPLTLQGIALTSDYAGIGPSSPLTVNVGIYGATNVYTMLNGFGPTANQTGATITFTGSGGAFESFTLVNGVQVRDYYQGGFANTINGTTTQQVFSVSDQGGAATGATPETSNSSTGLSGIYVLDAQNFSLSAAFATQTLTSFTITNGSGSEANMLFGTTIRLTEVRLLQSHPMHFR